MTQLLLLKPLVNQDMGDTYNIQQHCIGTLKSSLFSSKGTRQRNACLSAQHPCAAPN